MSENESEKGHIQTVNIWILWILERKNLKGLIWTYKWKRKTNLKRKHFNEWQLWDETQKAELWTGKSDQRRILKGNIWKITNPRRNTLNNTNPERTIWRNTTLERENWTIMIMKRISGKVQTWKGKHPIHHKSDKGKVEQWQIWSGDIWKRTIRKR